MTVDLKSLLERVEAASGPDREIDDTILRSLDCVRGIKDNITGNEEINTLGPKWYSHPAPITSSIDAAVALFKQKQPNRLFMLREVHPDHRNKIFPKAWAVSAQVYSPASGWGTGVVGHGDTSPLALLAALLLALISEGAK